MTGFVRQTTHWPDEPYLFYAYTSSLSSYITFRTRTSETRGHRIRKELCEILSNFKLNDSTVISYDVYDGKHITIFGFYDRNDAFRWKLSVDFPLYVPYFSRLNCEV